MNTLVSEGFCAMISVTESCLREIPPRFPQILFNDFTQNRWMLSWNICLCTLTQRWTRPVWGALFIHLIGRRWFFELFLELCLKSCADIYWKQAQTCQSGLVCISVSTGNATNALYASDTGYIVSRDCELCLAGGGLLPCLRSEVTPAVCCSSRAAFSGLGLQVDQ